MYTHTHTKIITYTYIHILRHILHTYTDDYFFYLEKKRLLKFEGYSEQIFGCGVTSGGRRFDTLTMNFDDFLTERYKAVMIFGKTKRY